MSINAQPFNPTFKLIGNLVEDQVLTYDSSENAFVNSTNTGGTAGSGFDAAVNTGTGLGVWSGTAGTTLQFKTLIGGTDITIVDNGDALVINSTLTETLQTGTNMGTGTGIYDSKDATTHQLKFKSLAVGTGLTLTDDGAGTLTLVNTIGAGTTDADLTLSNLSDNATARTNLGVYSKIESDALYHKHDDAFVPSVNNTYDIGSSTLKYNDIYAETFQGTAVLADNLTTSGTTGQVLTYNGSHWVAADTSGGTLLGLADVSTVVPNDGQHLVWNSTTSLWTPSASGAGGGGYQDSDARNSISVSGDLSYNATTGVISYTATPHFSGAYADLTGKPTLLTNLDGTVKQDIIPDTNIAYDIGSDTKRFKDLYLSGNTISLGSALMSASSSGGISLPSGTTIGPATYGDFRPIRITDDRGINPNFNGNPVVANSTIIDQATYLNAVGSGTNPDFVPSVYSATQDGSNNITAITIVTSNEYGSDLQDYPTINTDYLMAIDAGIDITNPTAISASSQQVALSAGVISASIGGTSFDGAYSSLSGKPTIPTAVSELTNDSGFVTTDTDTTYTAGSGLTLVGTEFSNTAPDQTVALTGSGATTITGTYPNFTIASTDTDTNTTYTAGTNVTISGSNVISATDTNTDTTYTAGTGLTLVGTEFSMSTAHFDGAYGSLTGAPTIPADVSQLTDTTNLLVHVTPFSGAFTDLTGVATAVAGDDNKVLYYDHATTSFKWKTTGAHFDGDYNSLTNKPTIPTTVSQLTNDSGFITTDTNTTYTAGTGLTLTGTVFSMSTAHFDGAFSSLSGVATAVAGDDGKVLYYDHATTSLKWKTDASTPAGYNNTNWDTAFGWGDHSTAGYLTSTTAHYTDSDVNTHLNVSGATANQVLKWTGTDYAWVTSTDSDTTYTAGTGLTLTGTAFSLTDAHFDGVFSSLTGKPTTLAGYGITDSPSTIDDFADVTIATVSDGQFLKYNNTSGDWENETVTIPVDVSDLTDTTNLLAHVTPFSGVFADLTSKPTTIAGYGITDGYDNADVDLHIKQSTATNGQVLSWDGSNYVWVTAPTGAHYTDADARSAISGTTGLSYNSTTGVMTLNASMDTLLDVNSTGATLNQVLKWNGTAWAPALDIDTTYTAGANVGISGGGVISATDTNTTYVNTDWDHDALTNFVANEHIDWTQSGAGTIHADNYTDTNTDTTYTAGANVSISGSNVISATDTNTTYTAGTNVTITAGAINATDTNTTYVNTDWNHDLLTGFVANEHIDWTTDQGATNIHAGNYTDTDTVYTSFNTDFDTRLASNGYANSDVDSHLNTSGASSSEVLSWNGTDYTWVTNTGSGATDKIEEGNSSVEVIDGGSNGHIMFNTNGTDCWSISGHILPEAHETYDIGSADKKVRHLFLSDNSLKMGDNLNTIKTSGTNLLFNDDDVMDYDNLKNTPDTVSSGTGIQVNSGVVSINASLDLLSNVSAPAPATGEVLKWNGSAWAPAVDLTSGSSAMNDLSDVDTTGISTGQYLKWDGSSFVASTVTAGASSIDALTDVDTTTSAPSNGDVLTWVQADSEWAPAAPSGGSGSGTGATIEYFKLNYATNGNLTSITNATSGVSATILSATGGDVEISFSSTNYPPSGIIIYGYAYSTNEYNIKNAHSDMNTRKMSGGGSSGSPIAFGTMGSVDLTLDLREATTGAGRGFGTTTHAWVMFTTV